MEEAFGYVLWIVVIIAAIVAIASLKGQRYDHIGRGGLFEDDGQRKRDATPATTGAVRDEEIRQMVDARNDRREARGQPRLDVDEEIARLTPAPVADAALTAEVRQLVVARNERRERQGKEPLDVEEEIQRQLRDLLG
jgi:hypothetical protein